MAFVLKIKENIKKLQDLPMPRKKIILWTIVALVGIIWIYFWFQNAKEKIQQIDTKGFTEQLNVPSFLDAPGIQENLSGEEEAVTPKDVK